MIIVEVPPGLAAATVRDEDAAPVVGAEDAWAARVVDALVAEGALELGPRARARESARLRVAHQLQKIGPPDRAPIAFVAEAIIDELVNETDVAEVFGDGAAVVAIVRRTRR